MKHLLISIGICLSLILPVAAQTNELQALSQQAQKLAAKSASVQELRDANQALLEMYLWSKDNFEVRQWPELWNVLKGWPAVFRYQSQYASKLAQRIQTLEASYWLLLHDYTQAHQTLADNKDFYAAALKALIGEADPENPGIWRISLAEARNLQKSYPSQVLAQLILTEAILERLTEPADQALLKEASQAVSHVLKQFPKQAFAHYQQGQLIYFKQGSEAAYKYFLETALPASALAAEAIGNFYAWVEKNALAAEFYELARAQDPANLRLYHKLSTNLMALQNQDLAVFEAYLRGLVQLPEEASLYQGLQELYQQVDLNQLPALLKKYPLDSYLLHLIQGDLALYEKDFKTGQHWYHLALEQRPKRLEAYFNLLNLYWSQRDLVKIEEVLAKAEQHELKHAQLDYWRGVLALQQGQLDQAIKLLEPLIQDSNQARYMLAMVYRQKKDYLKARQLMAALLEQDNQNVQLILTVGDLYLAEGNTQAAQELYLSAQRLEAYNPLVYYSLGNLYSKLHQDEQAEAAFERAILLDPDEPDFRNNLGNLYMRQKRFELALQEFEGIIQYQPDYATAYYNLACIYALNSHKHQALIYLKRALLLDQTLKQVAREDQDLNALRSEQAFKELLR